MAQTKSDRLSSHQLRPEVVRSLTHELEQLSELSLNTLKERWCELYGASPPPRLGQMLLIKGIGYRLQEQVLGGLSSAARRRLTRAAGNIAEGRPLSLRTVALKPGARLLREWQGITHEVIVREDGVSYRGEIWRSLSAVACEITGTRWSGPAFFGLRRG